MALRGERFELDLDLENGHDEALGPSTHGTTPTLLGDIIERHISTTPSAPAAPSLKNSATGFPALRTRNKTSRFLQSKQKPPAARQDVTVPLGVKSNKNSSLDRVSSDDASNEVKKSIDEENKGRLAQMSSAEIQVAQAELTSTLSPSLIERLLKRANIEEDTPPAPLLLAEDSKENTGSLHTLPGENPSILSPQIVTGDSPPERKSTKIAHKPPTYTSDVAPSVLPADLQPVSTYRSPSSLPAGVHFPTPPVSVPDLDPSSPDFLEALQQKYFPNLPADPSALSWMKPVDPAESEAYSTAAESVPAHGIRFDFRGRLLPPRVSAEIPVTKGLHHHGHAPDRAGYTIPELAYLARSAVPAQRCAAYQTLGRILYRLGRGDFGHEGQDLYDGLWGCMTAGRVTDGMIEAAKHDQGHRSVWATATEALWLWRKGGGRQWTGR